MSVFTFGSRHKPIRFLAPFTVWRGKMRELTFGDFAKLATKRGVTTKYLAERFTDKIKRPSEFFHLIRKNQDRFKIAKWS